MSSITKPKLAVSPKNLAEVLQYYESAVNAEQPSKVKDILYQLQTALVRYTLPGFGAAIPQGKRVSPREVKAARAFMKKISPEQLRDALNVQAQVFEQLKVAGSSQRTYRHALTKLLDFCDSHNWWKVDQELERLPLRRQGNARCIRTTQRKYQEPYSLGAVKGDAIPDVLQKQLDEFHDFLIVDLGLANASAECSLLGVRRALGWFYHYDKQPLEKLALECLIQFTPIRSALNQLPVSTNWIKHLSKQEELKRDAARAADITEIQIRKITSWLRQERNIHPGTERSFLVACLNCAKFLYRYETDKSEADNYEDIPVIKRIRSMIREVNKRQEVTPSPVDISKKWLSWEDWLEVVETLRQESRQTVRQNGCKRELVTIAHSLQRYLIAAFFSYIPPLRQQVIRSLEVGRNLIYVDGQWHIQLKPSEYKTGKTYGDFHCEILNIDFNDGTCFYDYIEAWLYDCSKLPGLKKLGLRGGLRNMLNPTHNLFLTQKNGKPLEQGKLTKYIRDVAYRIKGKVVTAHLLRDMFVSHLMEIGCSDSEMNAVAFSMQHSPEVQRRIYDKRTKQQKTAPGTNLARKIAENAIKKKSEQLT